MTITRVPLNRCSVKDCHFPEEEHYCWGRGLVPHVCSGDATHQHRPRKGMGGRNPKSQVVAMLCSYLHDQVDNGTKFKDAVETRYEHSYYRLWKPGDEYKSDGYALIWKEIPSGQGTEGQGVAGLLGTLPGTGVPETAGPEELGENDGIREPERTTGLDGKREGEPYPSRPEVKGGSVWGASGLGRQPSQYRPNLQDLSEESRPNSGDLEEGPDARTNDTREGAQMAVDSGRRPRSPERNLSVGLPDRSGPDGASASFGDGPLSSADLAPDFGPDYLNLPEEFTLQDAVPWAAMVGKWEHGRQWYAGDLLLACEARFGHERLWGHSVSPDGKTFVDLLGMTYPSLRNCQRVCEAFSPAERFPLSFGHHAACYTHPERDRLMEQATAEGWTVSKLRGAVSGHTEPETHSCPLCGAEHRVKATMS